MAALAGAGARVGVNYLKHYGKRAVGGDSEKGDLHEANADAVYKTFFAAERRSAQAGANVEH